MPAGPVSHAHGDGPRLVSIYALIVDAERFHGQEISVSGVASFGDGVAVLAVSREAAGRAGAQDKLLLDLSRCKTRDRFLRSGQMRYCGVVATVDARTQDSIPQYACVLRVLRVPVVDMSDR
jgi:hypothetical protein